MYDFSWARIWLWRWSLCLAAVVVAITAGAQQAATPEGPALQMVAEYVKAWNARDVAALGRMWTADGEMIDTQGSVVDRKALLGRAMSAGGGPRPVFSVNVDKVRFLEPNVALVDGESRLATPEGSVLRQTRFSGVLVKQDGTWKIRLIRQLSSRQRQSPPEEPLKDLSWMLGEWSGLGNGMCVHTTAEPDMDGRYAVLRSEYEPENGKPFDAEVRVGWDPEANAIKSWYFDSRGVISTTIWERNGDHWLGAITGVQNDGERFTGTIAITKVDDDSYLRTISNMKVGDKAVPNQELRMFRIPEKSAE